MLQVLDFYADWCGPCKVMDPILADLEKDYTGKIDFKRIDVDAEGSLAEKFGVMSIPTFVIVKDEKEISRKVGAMPKDSLRSWIDENSH